MKCELCTQSGLASEEIWQCWYDGNHPVVTRFVRDGAVVCKQCMVLLKLFQCVDAAVEKAVKKQFERSMETLRVQVAETVRSILYLTFGDKGEFREEH